MQKKINKNSSKSTTQDEQLQEILKLACRGMNKLEQGEAEKTRVWKVYVPDSTYQKILSGTRRMLIARHYVHRDTYPGQMLELINLDDLKQRTKAVIRQMITYTDIDDMRAHAPFKENGFETEKEIDDVIERLKAFKQESCNTPAAVVILFEVTESSQPLQIVKKT